MDHCPQVSEVIHSIKEVEVSRLVETHEVTFSGFLIRTNKRVLHLLIEDQQNCCETWGYFLSEDDTSQYIGAIVIDVSVVDDELMSYPYPEGTEDRSTMFVNITTDKGVLQFVAYNAHEGSYSHQARLESSQTILHKENL